MHLNAPRAISSVWNTLSYLRDPYGHFRRCAARSGDPFVLDTLAGRLVVTGHPDGVRAIFAADPDQFEVWGSDMLTPMLGPSSVLLVSGARHKRDRKLLTPPFHGARMRAYGDLMLDVATREIARWSLDRVFDVQAPMQSISLEVILRAVFGITEPARMAAFQSAILEWIEGVAPSVLFFPFLRQSWLPVWQRFEHARARLDAMIFDEIARRRRTQSPGEDILGLVLASRYEDGGEMSDQEIRDEMLTLVVAGHETTAVSLSWALYWLHWHPHTLERLRGEIDAAGVTATPEAIAQLPYLDAVCNEAMRLNPILPDVTRRLRAPLDVRGTRVETGDAVAAAICLVHEREDLYPEPRRFRPERFLARKFSPFEFIPFGGGARRCLGAAFASYEMKLVLATIVRRCDLQLANGMPIEAERRSLTMGPAGGVPMVLRARRIRGDVNAVREGQHTTAAGS